MADVLAVRDEYRAKQWAMVVQECSHSNLSIREFCRQRGISEKSYYYWQRKLRQRIVGDNAAQLVALESRVAQDEILQIRYRDAELKLPSGVDIDAVAAILRSLQSL